MKDFIYRWTPIALGLALGFVMFRPPAWLSGLGPLAWLVNLFLCALVFYMFVFWMVLASLPREITAEPLDATTAGWDGGEQKRALEALGFVPIGGPMRVNVGPSAIVYAFVHPQAPVYANLFRTGTATAKISYDLVSMLDGNRGGLTTGPLPDGAALPSGAGGFRQVFPGAAPAELLERHVEGLRYLQAQGVPPRAVSADTYLQDFRFAMGEQRERFMNSPLVGTWMTMWRGATRRVPFIGPLAEQAVAARQLATLQSGSPSGVF